MDLDRRSLLVAAFLTAAVAGCEKNANGQAIDSISTTDPIPRSQRNLCATPRQNGIRCLGRLAATKRRNGNALRRSQQARPVSSSDEMASRLVQRTTYLCDRSSLRRRVRHLVGQQWERFLAQRRSSCWARRICETYCPHSALRRGVGRSTRSRRYRNLWSGPCRHPVG
jgi:NAD-dependent dihydropyrimidine dehydrogenase PreA subunit